MHLLNHLNQNLVLTRQLPILFISAEPNYQADNFVPEFNGDSFIEYKYNDNAYTKIAFEVWFLTYADNGE